MRIMFSSSLSQRLRPNWRVLPWAALSLLIAALVILPLITVLVLALGGGGSDGVWAHLASTTLPRYLGNTLSLMAMVGTITGLVGTATGMADHHV